MITVKYDKPIKLKTKQSIFVSFPYKAKIVDVMRTFYGRYYHADTKTWELDYSSLDEIKRQLPNEEFTVIGKPINNKKFNEKDVDRTISLPKNLKTELYPFQIDTFYEGMAYDKYILNLDTGTGKTISALTITSKRMELGQVKRCLIIPCIATLKYNWQNEIKKHFGEDAKVLGNRQNKRGVWSVKSNDDKLDDLNHLSEDDKWLITNIESLRNANIKIKLKKLLDRGEIDCIIVDECHKCVHTSALQTRALMLLENHCKYSLLLTGTILMNKPTDLYVPLKIVGIEEANFKQFKNRYCILGGYNNCQIIGFRHLDHLQDILSKVSKRIKKEEVLTELPPQVFIDEYVEMGTKQSKIYSEILQHTVNNIDNVKLSPNPLARMIRLRQATADTSILSTTVHESVKFGRAMELIDDIIENDESVLVFSNWETVVNKFNEYIDGKYKTAVITGKVKDREGEIRKFNTDGCNILIMTIGAGGTGLTLNKANNIIMLDEPWTATDIKQLTSRNYRIGQTKTTVVYTLMCKNTVDEHIHLLLHKKKVLGEAIVDSKYNLKDEAVLKFILTGEGGEAYL